MGVRRLTDAEQFVRRWSALHSGIEPSPLVRRWLRFLHPVARRLRVRPMAITLAALAVGGGAPAVCLAGGRWAIAAAFLVVLSGVLDSLDGAVAALTGRASGFGAVVDSLADRLADTGYFLALWLVGAPGWLAGIAAGAAALQEYLRARAAGLGLHGAITVWERPTRVILCALVLLGSGLITAAAADIAIAGAAAGLALGAAGIGQLMASVRRRGE